MATAKLNREYAARMCGIGAIMLALSAWSVYDGAVAWPRANAELASVRDGLVAGCRAGITPEEREELMQWAVDNQPLSAE